MKLKSLSILAGAIALSLTAIPFSANAKPVQQLAQAQQQPAVAPPPQIQLNKKQQDQVRVINAEVRKQIEGVLTQPQREQLKKSLQARRDPQGITQDLKLTPDQGRRLQQIVAGSQKKIFETVLTPQQQNQIRQYYQSQSRQNPGGRPR
jgi:periplasmic protein CpxP/Spy